MIHKILLLIITLVQAGHLAVFPVNKIQKNHVYYDDGSNIEKNIEIAYPNCETMYGKYVVIVDGEYGGLIK